MTPASAIVPWLLTAHLAALAISAIPSPEAIRAARGTRESADDAVSRVVRPVLDSAAVGLVAASDTAWRITSPIRPMVRLYVSTLGLGQTWSMFASPPRGSQFLRFRHFVREKTAPAGAPEKVISEIVFPAAPYGTFRGLGAFWQSHGDKAISNAIEAYYQERARRRTAGMPEPREGDAALDAALARSFVPLVQYYHRRFAATLPAGDVLVRSETWSGWADSPHRGERRVAEAQRTAALAPFAAGPVADVSEIRRHPIDTEAVQADIRWTLLYVQNGGSSD